MSGTHSVSWSPNPRSWLEDSKWYSAGRGWGRVGVGPCTQSCILELLSVVLALAPFEWVRVEEWVPMPEEVLNAFCLLG